MTYEERCIVDFLSRSPKAYFSKKEIARHAVKRQEYEANPTWADAALRSLVGRGVVEVNAQGLYRLNPNAVLGQ